MPVCQLPSSGLTIGYDEVGSGAPLVLLHAFPLDRTMWRPQLEGLADVARIIAPDLPGFGASSADPRFEIEGVADAIAEFLTALALPTAVVGGLSMGGYITLALARRHAARVSGLILADTRAGVDDSTTRANRTKSIAVANEKGAAALFAGMLPKVLSEHTHASKPDVVASVKAIAAKQSGASCAAALAALRDRPDGNPGLKAIAVPALVLVGEHDTVTPPLAAANLSAQIRGSKLVHIPDAGHLSNLENPEAFNAAVRTFLARSSLA
jgi:pimeloyl-ACP methyl ester carboxylesterase